MRSTPKQCTKRTSKKGESEEEQEEEQEQEQEQEEEEEQEDGDVDNEEEEEERPKGQRARAKAKQTPKVAAKGSRHRSDESERESDEYGGRPSRASTQCAVAALRSYLNALITIWYCCAWDWACAC